MIEGVDYSFGRPNLAELVAAKKQFVVRYLDPVSSKGLRVDEYRQIMTAGLAVVTVYERGANMMLGGRSAGITAATEAAAQISAVGLPTNQVVYFAADWDARSSNELAAIVAFLEGAGTVLTTNRVGIYGSATVMDEVRALHAAKWLWQTYAWSGGRIATGIHLLQYANGQTVGGASVDFCKAFTVDYGQDTGSTAAGLTVTPIAPKPRRMTVSTGYKVDHPASGTTPASTEYALAGDGVGDAAWITVGSKAIADEWAAVHGPFVGLSEASWALFKKVYTSPAKVSVNVTLPPVAPPLANTGGAVDPAEVQAIVDAIHQLPAAIVAAVAGKLK